MSSERRFSVNGYQLAAKEWNVNAPCKVIACHGWLDNAASFDVLAPLLDNCHLIALDMPGHGHSDHKSPQASYNIWDDLLDILAVADCMGWQRFNLLGHSRGAIMSMLLSAAMPERVKAMVLLDAIYPDPVTVEDTPKQLRRFLTSQRAALNKRVPSYNSIDEAITARSQSGKLSQASAGLIVERGLYLAQGRYCWRNDRRLLAASAFKMTAEHNQVLANAIEVPNLLLLAEQGLGRSTDYLDQLKRSPSINVQILAGSHHFHMEEQAVVIAKIAQDLFSQHHD